MCWGAEILPVLQAKWKTLIWIQVQLGPESLHPIFCWSFNRCSGGGVSCWGAAIFQVWQYEKRYSLQTRLKSPHPIAHAEFAQYAVWLFSHSKHGCSIHKFIEVVKYLPRVRYFCLFKKRRNRLTRHRTLLLPVNFVCSLKLKKLSFAQDMKRKEMNKR